MTWEMLLAIIGAFGGLEFFKFILYRKQNGRVEEAKADDAELDVLIKHQEFSDKQLAEKDRQIKDWEERYGNQTERLRTTQDELIKTQKQLGAMELKYQHAHLWECQTGSCRSRVPSNPMLWGMEYTPTPDTLTSNE
jgi:septal ring factor EnvC (AmiA/AmiB activator)